MYLEGTENERDLGGMVTSDHRRIKKGLFLRTDALDKLTDDDVRVLRKDYRLAIIIDLRTEEETKQRPDREIENASYVPIPLFVVAQAGMTREEDTVPVDNGVLDMVALYRIVVASDKISAKVARAFRLIMDNRDGDCQKCSLFHCVAGKDRTGIMAMLILGVLGVSEEDIMKDYMLTNVTGEAIARKAAEGIRQKTGNAKLAEQIRIMYMAHEEYLMGALDYIHEEYGTIRNYCIGKLKISEEELDAFRERVLE